MNTASPRRRSRLLFRFVAAAAVILMTEGLCALAFRVTDGKWFSYSRVAAEIDAIASEDERNPRGASAADGVLPLTLHPYLGYVYDRGMNGPGFRATHRFDIDRFGWVDDDGRGIHRRSASTLIVGIVGGSVALHFANDMGDVIATELQRIPGNEGKKVRIVRLALGAYKQPQQLMALSWYLSLGGELDILINLDGYNEVALPGASCVDLGVHPDFPWRWRDLVAPVADRDSALRLGNMVHARQARKSWASSFDGGLAQCSASLLFLWKIRDHRLAAEFSKASEALQSHQPDRNSFTVTGPGIDDIDRSTLPERLADHWVRCSLLLNDLCKGNGIRYFHFLQPNQYVGKKPMGDDERAIAILEGHPLLEMVTKGYAALQRVEGRLRDAKIAFHDLVDLFAQTRAITYSDNSCHLNRTGNDLVAAAILIEVFSGFSAPAQASELAARIATWQLDESPRGLFPQEKPIVPEWARVPQVAGDGAEVASIAPGTAGAGGLVPILRVRISGAPPATMMSIVVRDVVGAAAGWLVVNGQKEVDLNKLIDESIRPEEARLLPVRVSGSPGLAGDGILVLEAPFVVAILESQRPIFARAVFRDGAAAAGWSVSNVIVLR